MKIKFVNGKRFLNESKIFNKKIAFFERYTNADLKFLLYVRVDIKILS